MSPLRIGRSAPKSGLSVGPVSGYPARRKAQLNPLWVCLASRRFDKHCAARCLHGTARHGMARQGKARITGGLRAARLHFERGAEISRKDAANIAEALAELAERYQDLTDGLAAAAARLRAAAAH